jgi:glycogen operon protein
VHRFAQMLNAHRQMRDFEPEPQGLTLNQLLAIGDRSWHGVKLGQPDWSDDSHSLACYVICAEQKLRFYLILNAFWEPLEFELPPTNSGTEQWHRWIDTSLISPDDIAEWPAAPAVPDGKYLAAPRSVTTLFAHLD